VKHPNDPQALPDDAEMIDFAPAPAGWVATYLDRVEVNVAHVFVFPLAGWATVEWATPDPGIPECAHNEENTNEERDACAYCTPAEPATLQAVRPWIVTTSGVVRDYLAVEPRFLCLTPPNVDPMIAARTVVCLRNLAGDGLTENEFDVELNLQAN
jgi:hypothetical protein